MLTSTESQPAPFVKSFLIKGMGYQAEVVESADNTKEFPYVRYLSLRVGHSFNIYRPIPDDVGVNISNRGRKIIIFGLNKTMISTFAKNVYAHRKPGVYTGDGIRIKGYKHRRKVGKKDGKKGKL
jgi:ribosomal protein L6P/L9E